VQSGGPNWSRPYGPVWPPMNIRVTEAADGTFPVELWSSRGGRSQLIYKTLAFQTRELAEAWIVPVGGSIW
jgi:hypothetical protein